MGGGELDEDEEMASFGWRWIDKRLFDAIWEKSVRLMGQILESNAMLWTMIEGRRGKLVREKMGGRRD